MSERLIQAMKLVVEEQEEIRKIVETQGKIIETQGFAIANLEKKVQELRKQIDLLEYGDEGKKWQP